MLGVMDATTDASGRASGTGMRFAEAMAGHWRRSGSEQDLPIRFDVTAETSTLLKPLGTVTGTLSGTLTAGDLVDAAPATGTIEVSPVEHRRIRYTLDFADRSGRPWRFDGWKSIDWLRPLATWTTLPGTIYDADGSAAGAATLRFPLRAAPSLLASMRLVRQGTGHQPLEGRRWDGRPGRLEVWYDTITDPVTGTGLWLHHELVAPPAGRGGPLVHGWAALFPPDGPPLWDRFGPEAAGDGPWFSAGGVTAEPGRRTGRAGRISWDLRYEDGSAPLFTFPPATWRRELLPGAQIVPSPSASFTGRVDAAGRHLDLERAPGAAARTYGHGNAERWAWLHADLGDGDVVEVVAATPRRPGLRRLPPLPVLRLRTGGRDWPANPLSAAPRLRCRIGLPTWTVSGRIGDRRLHITVTQPPERCVEIPYTDPDGAGAVCTNTERADAVIVVERLAAGGWETERHWQLEATAHAEVGARP